MPTWRDGETAAARAADEARAWAGVAAAVAGLPPVTPGPSEAEVVVFHDPAADLERRTGRWRHHLADHSLVSLAEFAAGLAAAEAEAWEHGPPDLAVGAYVARRHLASDRILHWAVPWLLAVSGLHHGAASAAETLLTIGDRLRPAPGEARGEGLHPPGEDSLGPLHPDVATSTLLGSLWSGAVFVVAAPRGSSDDASRSGAVLPAPSPAAYRAYAGRWAGLASAHEGTAALWNDLARRAAATARLLDAGGKP